MNRSEPRTKRLINWVTGGIRVEIDIDQEQHVYVHSVSPAPGPADDDQDEEHSPARNTFNSLCLNEVRLDGEGSQFGTSKRQIESYLGQRLRYVSHKEYDSGVQKILEVTTHDRVTQLTVTTHFSTFTDIPVLRTRVNVTNNGEQPQTLQAVSSMVYGGLGGPNTNLWEGWRVHFAHNNWFREAQWQERTLPQVGIARTKVNGGSRAQFSISNQGSFSTGGYLPMGGLSRADGSLSYLWQIEHNGSWKWEIGDYRAGLYFNASGPTDQNHSWSKRLGPGESFDSAPAALAVVPSSFESAFVPLNSYRRLMRRKHEDNDTLPIIFNDYMNCLMGDPTTEKVEALIAPAKRAGSEVFVIDCGWYSDDSGWWETVGEWKPSKRRFPGGLEKTLRKIRDAGMVPGLWLEPEVMGIKCPVADQLPPEAFFQRNGRCLVEHGRYQLDYRHPDVISRMNEIVSNLVREYEVGYFKFDYNIDITQGTDVASTSPGDGLLEHNRAYLRWVNGLFDLFPGLVIENCSSGGQRMDYAMLETHPLQSTSDQEDPVLYCAITAAAPTAVCPEQSATWAYPQSGWSDELNSFTLVNSLLGRVHLSGTLAELSQGQSDLVRDAMSVYKRIRADLKVAGPFWPLGLPVWEASWQALGLDAGEHVYLAVWRARTEESQGDQDEARKKLPITGLKGKHATVQCIFPAHLSGSYEWEVSTGEIIVTLPVALSARLLKVTLAQEDGARRWKTA
ncbi:related to Melibiase subfamily [Cephalotrichum gorgonifer]|uniref:alpha-galactosidase n=1 Tax=Cephalotrichum gorgonifer TaxID=2041049 RepID=A0AAE8MS12_9PEZI|nr:related to Melibiase subfamily [Cephalotrichum gorgonifer]